MNIRYEKNAMTGEMLANMRNLAGWGNTSALKADIALKNTPFSVTAFDDDILIGIGRIIGDGALIWYIQDVIVLPEYQGKGIGTAIMNYLIEYAKLNSIPNERFTVGLMSAKGKEIFYEKLGFRLRPNENEGSGMVITITGEN